MSTLICAVDKSGFFLLTLCVVLAPIPFGSNSAGLAGLIGLLLSFSLLGSLFVPVRSHEVRHILGVTVLLSVLLISYSIVQVIPEAAAASVHSIWTKVDALIDSLSGTISVSRYQPLQSVGYVLIPLAAFMSSLVYVRDDERYMRFLHIVLGFGFVTTVFCIGQHLIAPGALLWTTKIHYLGFFTGTFVNANTAATYFGLLLLMSLSACSAQLGRVDIYRIAVISQNWSPKDRRRVAVLAIYSLWTFVFALALLLTKSRAGILSTLVGVAIFASVSAFLSLWRRASIIKALTVSALWVVGVCGLFALYGERLLLRLQWQGLADEARMCTYRSTWNAIKDNFWLGAGLGTFQDVFPAYRMRGCGLYGYWEMAHSMYLEAWLGLGVVFLACALIVYYQLIKTYVRGLRERRRFRFVPLACLGLLVILTLHSLVDFSLQIPAVAVLTAAALGSGVSISLAKNSA